MGTPQTRYRETPSGFVAFKTWGDGDRDIIFLTNWLTNVEVLWEEPSARRYLERLGRIGRVLLADKRGTGASDPIGVGRPPPVENHVDDVLDLMSFLEIEEASLIGDTEGGTLALVLAATHPERFPELVLINSFARLRRAVDYRIGAPDEVIDVLASAWKSSYGQSAEPLELIAPSMVGDVRFAESWLRQIRLSMPPGVAGHAVDWIRDTDVRSALPAVRARTLVLGRADARLHRIGLSRYLADHIEGATFKAMDGADTIPFYAGDFNSILDEVEEFLTGARESVDASRVLATVLFTDIVGSTALAAKLGDDRWLDLLSSHDAIVEANLLRFRGRLVEGTGDGVLAVFDGPHRAILCALSIRDDLSAVGLDIRAGLHTGEVERRGSDLAGIAVHIASRVMDVAEGGGVLVSRTVKDLVTGSTLGFRSCGPYALKGIPGEWELYEVTDDEKPSVRPSVTV